MPELPAANWQPDRAQRGLVQSLPLDPRSVTADRLSHFLNQRRRLRIDAEYDKPLLHPFVIAAWSHGELLVTQWLDGQSPYRALQQLALAPSNCEFLQLAVVTGRSQLHRESWSNALTPDVNGRMALELVFNGVAHRVSPFETISTNRTLRRSVDHWLQQRSLTVDGFFALGGQVALLEVRQFAVKCGNQATVQETYRCSPLVCADADVEQLSESIISGVARWFMTNQGDDGSLPYKYWPSSGAYSSSDNPIRRLMASVVFNRLSTSLKRQDIRLAARKNLKFNLERFYKTAGNSGVIDWEGVVKLGALAMAGLAIIESPFCQEWGNQLSEIRKTIDKLWLPSGAFRTFLYPASRNDNQNFYPGEALVFWATCLTQTRDEELLARALKSVNFYREHFRRAPNPAFVPWHCQAATMLYRLTGDPSLRAYVFEMADWLLPHQQWGGVLPADHWGRFYSPGNPSYGPPHASATGVYLEGLVDALALAIEANSTARIEAYRTAIERGIRSIAQLQFTNIVDAYYVSYRERVIGGIRTESDNNEIRIDNMQHALAALLKYRELTRTYGNLALRQVTRSVA